MNNKPYRRGSSLFRVRTPSLSTLETADLEDRFLTFLEHVENHNSMKKYLRNHYPHYKHDFNFLCEVIHFRNEEDDAERHQKCRKLLQSYFSSGRYNNRKRPFYDISISDELIQNIAREVWEYKGGKIAIPTYIYDEPFDVVSGLLARRIFGLYTENRKKKKLAHRNSTAEIMEKEFEREKNKVLDSGGGSNKSRGTARRESIKRTRLLFGVTNKLNKFVKDFKNFIVNEDNMFNPSINGNDTSVKIQAQHQLGIYKQGFLYKKGEKRTNWIRRWFLIKSDVIYYFKAPESVRPLGTIWLKGMKVVPASREMREKHPNTFQIVASSLKDREKRTYYLYPDAGLKHKEEKKWRKAIEDACERASQQKYNTNNSSSSSSSSSSSNGENDDGEEDVEAGNGNYDQNNNNNSCSDDEEEDEKKVRLARRQLRRQRRRQKRKKQLEAEKLLLEKEELQEEEEDDDESEESDNEENVNVEEINTKTPIKKLVYYMENNLNDHDIHSSCLSVLREHCIYLDDDDLRMSQKRIWMNIVECIFNAIRRFRRNETIYVDSVVCLSILSNLNETFRETIIDERNILEFLYSRGNAFIKRSDLRRAYNKAIIKLEKNVKIMSDNDDDDDDDDEEEDDDDNSIGNRFKKKRRGKRKNENRRYSSARRRSSYSKNSNDFDEEAIERRRRTSSFDGRSSFYAGRGDINNARRRRGSSIFE